MSYDYLKNVSRTGIQFVCDNDDLPTSIGLSCFSKSARWLRRTWQFSAKNMNLARPL